MEDETCVDDLMQGLTHPKDLFSCPTYTKTMKELAALYLRTNKEFEAIYNLTESHGVQLRQFYLLNQIELLKFGNVLYNCITFESNNRKEICESLTARLEEMPNEWTIVQLTMADYEKYQIGENKLFTFPPLKKFYISRLPCGKDLNVECPIIVEREWPDKSSDLIEKFWKIKLKLLDAKNENQYRKNKIANNISETIKKYILKISSCLKGWLVLFLGTLCNKELSEYIRKIIDKLLYDARLDGVNFTIKQRNLTYLLAEGMDEINCDYLRSSLSELYPENKNIQKKLYFKIVAIHCALNQELDIKILKRNPVILILEDHLECIPWESLSEFQRYPYSRMPSIHFVHALYKFHQDHIKFGYREISDVKSKYLCSIYNDGIKQNREDFTLDDYLKKKSSKFDFSKKKHGRNNFLNINNISSGDFVYEYILDNPEVSLNPFKKSQIKFCQLLMGYEIAQLKDKSGNNFVFSNCFKLLITGSPSCVELLWTLDNECDALTMNILNAWLGGNNESSNNTIRKERKLLSAVAEIRMFAPKFFCAAGLVVRGIPTRAV